MKNQFHKERAREIDNLHNAFDKDILTEKKLATLPRAIQKHYRLCGFLDVPVAMNADVIWKESYIKLKPNQKWKPLRTIQFNSVNPIMRTAYMKVNTMFFAGKDYYKNGQGTMKGKILNLFTVIDAKGEELSQSALITSFCEMMLLSGYALQDYIVWTEIDSQTVQGTLSDRDFTVRGLFHFDEEGKFEYFETDDRYYDHGSGTYEKKKFSAHVHSYKKNNGFYQPENVSIKWLLDSGEFEYFKGTIERIAYNVSRPTH